MAQGENFRRRVVSTRRRAGSKETEGPRARRARSRVVRAPRFLRSCGSPAVLLVCRSQRARGATRMVQSTKNWGDPPVPNVTELWLTPQNVTDAAALLSQSTYFLARAVAPHPGRPPANIIRRKMPATDAVRCVCCLSPYCPTNVALRSCRRTSWSTSWSIICALCIAIARGSANQLPTANILHVVHAAAHGALSQAAAIQL